MKTRLLLAVGGIGLLAMVALFWWQGGRDDSRRDAVAALQGLDRALRSGDQESLLSVVVLPSAISGRSAREQVEFLQKALLDEITPDGLEILKQEGRYGPLREIFPEEADKWAGQASILVEDCIAFRLDRSAGPRMEVVLAKSSKPSAPRSALRVVRCNNVGSPPAAQLSRTSQP